MMTDTSDGELKLKKMESTLSTRTHSQIKSFGRKSGGEETRMERKLT